MARKFVHVSHSSSSDDGLWMSDPHDSSHEIHVIEFAYWENLDSSAIPTHGKYNVQAGYVDLTSDQVPNALRYCGHVMTAEGIADDSDGHVFAAAGTQQFRYYLAERLWHYGVKVVHEDISGNNRRRLMRCARANF